MSKLYIQIAENIDKQELIKFYYEHLPKETLEKFNIPNHYLLKQVLKYYNLPCMTPSEITCIQMKSMSADMKSLRSTKISAGNKGKYVSEETKLKMSASQKGKEVPLERRAKIAESLKGNIPWNKGTKGATHWKPGQWDKYWKTLRQNGNLGKRKTKIEERVEQDLISKYGREHVFYQYKDDSRYPFMCDFYIDSVDMFIEVNSWWHHGEHPFDPNCEEDIKTLNAWRDKALNEPNKKQYEEAIRIWTEIDPLKIKTAKENNLNYKLIYKY